LKKQGKDVSIMFSFGKIAQPIFNQKLFSVAEIKRVAGKSYS
jgi:hypothetical protein